MTRRPSMSGNTASPKMEAVEEIDERELRLSKALRETPAAEAPKWRTAQTRVGKKRITTLIEPELHRQLRVATAQDMISMEEGFRIGLSLYLAQPRKP